MELLGLKIVEISSAYKMWVILTEESDTQL